MAFLTSETQFDEHGGDPLYFAADESDQVIEFWLARNGWSKNAVADVRKAIDEMEICQLVCPQENHDASA